MDKKSSLILIGMFIGFIIGTLFGIIIVLNSPEKIKSVDIPTREQVSYYCSENGYEYGWLGDCKENQVVCFREGYNGAKYFDCVDWKVKA